MYVVIFCRFAFALQIFYSCPPSFPPPTAPTNIKIQPREQKGELTLSVYVSQDRRPECRISGRIQETTNRDRFPIGFLERGKGQNAPQVSRPYLGRSPWIRAMEGRQDYLSCQPLKCGNKKGKEKKNLV